MEKKSKDLDWIDSSRIGVATPCHVDWDTMNGDERKRFCGNCKKNVYNLSDMPESEATSFLTAELGAGRVPCIQFYKRADGTILFDNCPVALRAVRDAARRTVRIAASFVSLCLSVVAAVAAPSSSSSSSSGNLSGTVSAGGKSYDPLKAVRDLVNDQMLLAQGNEAPKSPQPPPSPESEKKNSNPHTAIRGDYVDPTEFAKAKAKAAQAGKKVTIIPGCAPVNTFNSASGAAAGTGTVSKPLSGGEVYPVKGEVYVPPPKPKSPPPGISVEPVGKPVEPATRGQLIVAPSSKETSKEAVKERVDEKKSDANK